MRRVVFRVLCSENKGTDQLCGHRAADMRFCFFFSGFAYAYVKSASKIAIQHKLEFSWGQKAAHSRSTYIYKGPHTATFWKIK